MTREIALGLALLVIFPTFGFAEETAEEKRADLQIVQLRGRFLYGELDGFAQTPRGGGPLTTDRNRPTLSELGIDHIVAGDVEMELGWQAWRARVGLRLQRADTRATLGEDLVSQGATFPAGTRVHSRLRLDTYRFGIGRAFAVAPAWLRGAPITVTPFVESLIFDFHYQLDGTLPSQTTDRAYRKFGARLGAKVGVREDRFGFEIEGLWGLPIGTFVRISSIEATALYSPQLPASLGRRVRLWLELGVLFEATRFEDSQSTPNRIRVDYGPALIAGVGIGF